MTGLAGRVAVLTGGSGGIGRGIALQLAERGATVVINGRNAEKADAALAEIRPSVPSYCSTSMPQMPQASTRKQRAALAADHRAGNSRISSCRIPVWTTARTMSVTVDLLLPLAEHVGDWCEGRAPEQVTEDALVGREDVQGLSLGDPELLGHMRGAAERVGPLPGRGGVQEQHRDQLLRQRDLGQHALVAGAEDLQRHRVVSGQE
jgi:hypothetical protein